MIAMRRFRVVVLRAGGFVPVTWGSFGKLVVGAWEDCSLCMNVVER